MESRMPGMLNYIIAAPSIQQVREKPLFGKPFVRLGKLFVVIGSFVFQQGGVLGYGLQNHPELLKKLIGSPRSVAQEHDLAASKLEEVSEQERTFHNLFVSRELNGLGINIATWPPDKRLEDKCNDEMVIDVITVAWITGSAIGYNYPETFKEYWDHSYRLLPKDEWQNLHTQGLNISANQKERPLSLAISEFFDASLSWVEADGAKTEISTSEQSILRLLVD